MESPVEEFPSLFNQLLASEDEDIYWEDDEEDINLDLLEGDNEDDNEDAILPPTAQF